MKYVIDEEILQNILNYLGNQPYKDVFTIVTDIQTKSIKYPDYVQLKSANDNNKSNVNNKLVNNSNESKSK